MNLNKENVIQIDAKAATVSISGSMKFYITDIKTCNIFAQLVINESKSELIKRYAPVENATDFSIKLRIIKPNNEPKEIDFTMLNSTDAFFMVDLTEDYKDFIGEYKCELFVDSIINGELERITTASFSYNVLPSIYNDLDEVIEADPDYSLVEGMIAKMDETIKSAEATIANADSRISENIENTNSKIDENIQNVNSIAEALETKIGDIDRALDEILGGDTNA